MDEFHQPLKPRSLWARLWRKRPTPAMVAMGLSVLLLAGFVGWAARTPAPDAAAPVARAPVTPADPVTTATTGQAEDAPTARQRVKIIRKGAGARGNGIDTEEFEVEEAPGPAPAAERAIPDARDLPRTAQEARRAAPRHVASARIPAGTVVRLPKAPLAVVTERSRYGPLPKVAANGRKPADAYARPVRRAVLTSAKPKIALVIGGLGLNARRTRDAIEMLPGVVTLAFAPYGKRLQGLINAARANGHEVLLELPMEPWGYPSVNPGPKTLLVSAGAKNIPSMRWLMARAAGYVGLINYAGQRFLANGEALAPVLHEAKRRGLVFIDNGRVPQSLLANLAAVIGLPAATAQVHIDAVAKREAIRAKLKELVALAERRGHAIGVGAAFDATVEELEYWIDAMRASGRVQFVPVSAIFKLQGRG